MADRITFTDPRKALASLDSARLGPFHTRMVLVTGSCWLWSAYGVVVIGFLIPILKIQWQVSSTQLGLLASFGLAGMMVGAVLAGILADRVGRRTVLAWTAVYMGLTFLLSALAWDYPSLVVFRILNGLGLGAVLPSSSTLVSEYSPVRSRGRLLVLLNGFWGLGGVVAALVGYFLIPRFGWQSGLLFGALAITSLPLVIRYIPESLRFLVSKNRMGEALQTIRRVAPEAENGMMQRLSDPGQVTTQNSSAGITPWSEKYRKRTFSLWFLWIALNFVFQGVFVWLPSILMAAGHPSDRASLLTLIISMGQIPGTLLAAYLADRTSRRRSVMVFLVALGASALLFGLSRTPVAAVAWGFMVAVGNGALWGMAYPFTTELYPTEMRAAATGWATGIGRIGGMTAPLAVGALIQMGIGNPSIFAMIAAMPLLTVLVLIGVKQETTGKALEEITGRS